MLVVRAPLAELGCWPPPGPQRWAGCTARARRRLCSPPGPPLCVQARTAAAPNGSSADCGHLQLGVVPGGTTAPPVRDRLRLGRLGSRQVDPAMFWTGLYEVDAGGGRATIRPISSGPASNPQPPRLLPARQGGARAASCSSPDPGRRGCWDCTGLCQTLEVRPGADRRRPLGPRCGKAPPLGPRTAQMHLQCLIAARHAPPRPAGGAPQAASTFKPTAPPQMRSTLLLAALLGLGAVAVHGASECRQLLCRRPPPSGGAAAGRRQPPDRSLAPPGPPTYPPAAVCQTAVVRPDDSVTTIAGRYNILPCEWAGAARPTGL